MTTPTKDFDGLRVAAMESRRAEEMTRLIERFGGRAFVSPSLREVPLEENPEAVDFAHRLMAGEIDIVVLTTGVGTRHLVAQIERHVDRQRFLDALSDVITIVRGPKPLAVLREWNIQPTHRAPEPNTWREVLELVDASVPVSNQVVAVQEYGLPNASLVAGLEARGARVKCLKVYRWDLPVDTAPLEANLRAIAAGERDVVLFTSAHQVVNFLRMGEKLGLTDDLRREMNRLVVGSIGPTTSEMLRESDLPVDFEPEHGKMGHLVAEAAVEAPPLLRLKRPGTVTIKPATTELSALSGRISLPDSLFLRACRREPVERTPIWLMRQAGRYMEEYRQVRQRGSFLDLCYNPQLCTEVMLTAVNRLGVDAAIIFADLLPMLQPMGFDLEFSKGEGPVIHNPIRERADIERVKELESVDSLGFVMETVRLTRAGLPDSIPVIGFAGAPFTLASYAIEGGSSRQYLHTKSLMYRDEGAWNALMGRLARSVSRYLQAQIEAGAQAVQLFDSWVGCLGPEDYRRFVLPHSRSIITSLPREVPVIHFAAGNPALLPVVAEAGSPVIGVDWRIRLDNAWRMVGHDRAVQGNLDPLVLLGTQDEIRRQAKAVLDQAAGRPGHIFNLGHGIVPPTPVENVIALIEAVKEMSAR